MKNINKIIKKWKSINIDFWMYGEGSTSYHGKRGEWFHAENCVDNPCWEFTIDIPFKINTKDKIILTLWLYKDTEGYIQEYTSEEKLFNTIEEASEYAFKMVKDYLKRHSKEK
jgi:hypothetical protein